MKARLAVLFLSLLVCAISAGGQTVLENESSLVVTETTADVSLTIVSKTRSAAVPVELTLLDTDGVRRAHVSETTSIQTGKRSYKFQLPLRAVIAGESDEIAWWRLSYRVGDFAGIASLSELMRDDFDLRASAFERVIPGEPLRVRVRALHPFTEAPVKGVAITTELTLSLDTDSDDDELIIKASGRTDSNGFAILDLKIPADVRLDDDPEIEIVGRKQGLVRKIEEDLDDEDLEGSAILTTDKPLYQPGQTFNVRALMLDPNNTILPNYEVEFSIEDEDDTVVFRQKINTSAFGIAAISWPIPENSKLGTYRVIVDADDDLAENQVQFKVSRYDLPNFSVVTKADKTYYLPKDTEARVEVAADYLFGKPVTNGKVRVVQETERKWNYREQKYDVIEGAAVEGTADASGKFIARLDLRKDIAGLISNQWQRYEDVSFAAYYTDPTSNRTEQRRFDIRLTKEPIHIYLIRHAEQHADLPLTAYVSTFYADGTPANCAVEIRDSKDVVSRFRTNSLGAGKFEIEVPREHANGSEYEIRIVARDKKGQIGTFDESFNLDDDEDAIRVTSDKAIYKPGEVVDLELCSTQRSGFVYVDIVKDWKPIDSRVVELHGGKATLAIPYKPTFKGDLVIVVYTDKDEGRWSSRMRAARGIVFPEPQNLVINAKFSKDEYRPSEDATVRFSVLDGSRRPVESAIGLGIFDKAIEERARTEADFGEGLYSRFFRLMGYQRSFGNITLKDLNDLDLTRPISPEMQLAAEVMLAGNWYLPSIYHSGNHDTEAKSLYSTVTTKQLRPLADAIEARYKQDGEHPIDRASLERILATAGINFDDVRDPWGQTYIAEFSINRTQDIVSISTAGPDKKAGTSDDFAVWSSGFEYFTQTGATIDEAVRKYHASTGLFVRDLETFTKALEQSGLSRSLLKDRWGRDYRIEFDVAGRSYTILFASLGPNGVFESSNYRSDDFTVWRTYTDYFSETDKRINQILSEEVNVLKKPFPRSAEEFTEMLKRGGLDIASVKDGYGRPVYVIGTLESRYTDQTTIQNGKTTIKPVTQELMMFKIRSTGADLGTGADDADLATFSGAITEAHKGTGFAKVEVGTVVFSGAKGAIGGSITDPNGAAVPGAEVIATSESDASIEYRASSNEDGKYLLSNLPSGRYKVSVPSYSGFVGFVQQNVEVRSQTLTTVDIYLRPAGVSETVDVTASASEAQYSSNSATVMKTKSVTKLNITFPYGEQTSTPRLREYFPESLVWQPELVTDKKGRAEMNFKMADNITTWKMFAIASNKKGKVGVVEKEVTAFQSFFVDLDPPKFLTEGDEIFLPSQVRNYSERDQKVDVTMDKADWFSFLGGGKQQVAVGKGSTQNAVFGFRASTPITGGKQRVTAIGQSDSDAIEKPVTVRPNGEEIVQTDSKVFTNSSRFEVNYPTNALANTQHATLKIYPNLFSHVSESVEGMLERPYGCGEQTISSTYPNLMILKFVKNDPTLREKALQYLRKGYARLIGYQVADGGFTYWGGKDTSDVALTAYALRFLNDAKDFIDVDSDVIRRAQDWLVAQQRADGSWTKTYRWERSEDLSRTKLITTYVARSLAMNASAKSASIGKALAYLKARNEEIDEPYAMALFGLASIDAGDAETARQIASRLEQMAIPEGSGVYWKLETNTPFYGWGTAGRVETTALALQLLTRVAKLDSKPTSDVVSKGLQFLFKNKDRYGVWYSTQTTINVLDAFLALLSSDTGQPQTLQVSINGAALPDLTVAADRIVPIDVDLRGKLNPTSNVIEIRASAGSPLMAQTVATHYIDWRDSQSANLQVGAPRALRLDYKCDKSNTAIMDEISCSVEAERVGFRGYGMLLAEIGTPPGADVSRESLENAIHDDWSVSRYDVLPDRIVFYLWSKPGGTRFNFKFRPRYGIRAQTPASIVYDYYNPEAHAMVRPLRFEAK